LDFRLFTASVSDLAGGVYLNVGSAVTGAEVFLKAVAISRNLGHPVAPITTANFDLVALGDYRSDVSKDDPVYYYRPRKNVINRPTSSGGQGYHIAGDHRVTIPTIHQRVTAALPAEAPTPAGVGTAALPDRAAASLGHLMQAHPDLEKTRPALARAYRALVTAYKHTGTLYLCGNGGSMADALHISGELLKSYAHPRPLPGWVIRNFEGEPDGERLARSLESGLRAVVLGANQALSSAVENDMPDRNMRYAQELLAMAQPGDVLLAISTSGNAASVVYAVEVARALGLTTIAMTGSSGGRLGNLVDVAVRAPAARTDRVQEDHIALYHALCEMLEVTFFGEDEG
jgi:D-sedoheptulose 7-phosphate isomerase